MAITAVTLWYRGGGAVSRKGWVLSFFGGGNGYFLSPIALPGPPSPEVFDLQSLYTPISFVKLFPHLSTRLPRPRRQ